MLALCMIQGKQIWVEQGKSILVDRLEQQVGEKISFDTVLGTVSGDEAVWGSPFIPGTHVQAEIENHIKGAKVRVFKRRRRKNSKRQSGYRHAFTQLKILSVATGH